MCLCLMLSSTTDGVGIEARKSDSPAKTPVAQNAFPKVFRPVANFVKRLFGKKRKTPALCLTPNVEEVTLSRTEIVAVCANSDNSCAEPPLIEVFTKAVDPENDVLTYNYTISGGQITGTGEKVIWDLSGLKPGTYTITAGVDDGCGVCGKTDTKEVKVIECPNCN